MNRKAIVLTIALALFAGACGQQQQQAATAAPAAPVEAPALSPEQLGELGAQLAKNPDRAEELLEQHRLTRESFETAIRDVTEDVDPSKRYAAAYKRASA
jgi:hypothetical protein